jgi:polysaccharide export outer membrane protein
MLGMVHVEGLEPSAAEGLIEKKLVDGGFFKNPHVSLLVKEYANQGVSVMGEVQRPGIYPLLGSHKLFDLISAAGGTTPKAGKFVLISHRNGSSQQVTLSESEDPSKWASSNVEVLPGDTLMVSKAGIVYVVGDVRLPGGFVMERGTELTVLEALALAQGANSTASLNRTKLIRKTPQGEVEEPVPLKKILASQASDVKLQPEDILFIPNSAAKSATRRGLEAALQAATGAAIYRF